MPSKKVINIILNWNSAADTINLLGLLPKQTYNNFHTIVIDNKSTDESIKAMEPYINSLIFIKNGKNLGYAGGNNIGIHIAMHEQADYIWILNPDICPKPETLSILIDTMEHDPSIGAIGPRICFIDNPNKIYSDGALIFPEKGFLVEHKNNNRFVDEVVKSHINEVDYVNGSAILIRTKTIADIGMFREDFFLYYEETEWCIRAKKLGWHIVCNSEATVHHKSSRKGFRYHYYMARNRILLSKVLNQYRLQSFKTEMIQITKLIGKPFFLNIFFITARLIGIFHGLISSPRKNVMPSISSTFK